MSGPKGYGYSVQSAELDRRRAVAAAQARCEQIRVRMLADAEIARRYGRTLAGVASAPAIPDSASALEAESIADAYAAEADALRDERDAARRASVAAAFADRLPAELEGVVTIDWSLSPTATPDDAVVELTAAEGVGTIAGRVFRGLSELQDEAARDRWFEQAGRFAAAGDVSRLRMLAHEVEARRRDERRRESLRREAAELVASAAGLPEWSRLEATALAVDTREDLRALGAQVAAARAAQLRRDERAFVVAQTSEALRELGYRVDEEFQAVAFAGEFAVTTRAGLDEHALQVRFGADGRMLTNTVALTRHTAAAADIAAEQATCSDLDRVVQRVADSGVALKRTHAVAPGVVPVERRVDAESPRRSQGTATRGQDRAR